MESILTGLEINAPQAFGRLQVFPLVSKDEPKTTDFMLLDEALRLSAVEVVETSEAGNVPVLKLLSRSLKPILLIDGEELVGAKQNRILNTTVLAAAGVETLIPVSCVEQGRWRYKSAKFSSSDHALFAKARAKKAAWMGVNQKARAAGGGRRTPDDVNHFAAYFSGNQSEIWNDVADKLDRLNIASASAAMSDGFDGYELNLRAFDEAFHVLPGQVGAAFAMDGKVVGLEYICRSDAFAHLFKKVLRSYSIDALERAAGPLTQPASVEDVRVFLNRVSAANHQKGPGVGLGSDIRVDGESLSGVGLVHEGAIVHMAAFDSALTV